MSARRSPRPIVARPIVLAAAVACHTLAAVAAAQVPPDSQVPPDTELPAIKTLPWEAPDRADAVLLPRRLSSAREMLARFQIDDSLLNTFYDRQPLSPDEDEILLKILFRLPQFGLDDIVRWRHAGIPWDELRDDPAAFRTEYYRLEGRAVGVERIELPAELATLFSFNSYYQVHFRPDGAPHPVVLCTRSIPRRWQSDAPRDERSAVNAMFLKTGAATAESQQFVFASAGVPWLPDGRDPDYPVTREQLFLAGLNVDVGPLEGLRQRTRLDDADREPFYALLDAARRAGDTRLDAECRADADLEELLTEPAGAAGRLMKLAAQARRITRVTVREPDIRQRYGIDHYYQVDAFVPLGDRTVMIAGGDEAQGPVYSNRFPATICVLELPPELSRWAETSSSQERLNVSIEIPAFFLKLWSYPSPYVASFDARQRQIAPMFIGLRPEVRQPPGGMSSWVAIAGSMLFLGALGATWIWMWRAARSDRQFERQTRARRQSRG